MRSYLLDHSIRNDDYFRHVFLSVINCKVFIISYGLTITCLFIKGWAIFITRRITNSVLVWNLFYSVTVRTCKLGCFKFFVNLLKVLWIYTAKKLTFRWQVLRYISYIITEFKSMLNHIMYRYKKRIVTGDYVCFVTVTRLRI